MKIMLEIENRAKTLQREYLREWRKRNKDKMRQYRSNYWLKKAASEQKGGQADGKETADRGK